MISKYEYVLVRVKNYTSRKVEENQKINAGVLQELIEQWEYDYDCEKEYRPEILTNNSK